MNCFAPFSDNVNLGLSESSGVNRGSVRELIEDAHVKSIPLAGAICAVAVVFYSAYTETYDGVGFVILLVFFVYFLNVKSGSWRGAAALSPTSGAAIHTPVREVAKGLASLVAGAVAVVIGLRVPDVRLGVAIALTAGVGAIVAFMLFVLRALNAWNSGSSGPL